MCRRRAARWLAGLSSGSRLATALAHQTNNLTQSAVPRRLLLVAYARLSYACDLPPTCGNQVCGLATFLQGVSCQMMCLLPMAAQSTALRRGRSSPLLRRAKATDSLTPRLMASRMLPQPPPRELFRRKFSCCIRLPKPLKRSFYNGFAGPVPRNFIDLLMSNFCILS